MTNNTLLREKISMKQMYRNYGVFAVFLLQIIIFSFTSPFFFTQGNILNILRQISMTGILAMGMTACIITAGIDLSVGSVIGLVTVVVAGSMDMGVTAVIFIGLSIGAAIGLVNGIGIAYGKLQPFIMTLGTMTAVSGLSLMYSRGLPTTIRNRDFLILGNGMIGRIPLPVIYMFSLLVIMTLVMKFTPFGRQVYSIGSNREAARLSGVNVKRTLVIVHVLSGVFAGIAGIIFASQLGQGSPIAGAGFETTAIAAVIVGGASMSGGEGNMVGTFIGSCIIGALANYMNLMGVNPFTQQFLSGAIIILAVLIHRK